MSAVADRAVDDYLVRVRSLIALRARARCLQGRRSLRHPGLLERSRRRPAPRAGRAAAARAREGGGVARVTAYPQHRFHGLDRDRRRAGARSRAGVRSGRGPDRGASTRADCRSGSTCASGAVTIPGKRGKLRGPRARSTDRRSMASAPTARSPVSRRRATGCSSRRQPARSVFPQSGGTLLILGGRGASDAAVAHASARDQGSRLARRCPNARAASARRSATACISRPSADTLTRRARADARMRSDRIELRSRVVAIAATPSGDRFYVLARISVEPRACRRPVSGSRQRRRSSCPGRRARSARRPVRPICARARGDRRLGLGRERRHRPGRRHDPLAWRGDVPFVAPDGAIARDRRPRRRFVDARRCTIARARSDGASEFWYPFVWNGLRARAAALDTAGGVSD